jgi:arsenate reductase-like glutaredoxin family protein
VTCGKTQGFLAKKKVVTSETVDARKNRLGPADARKLLKDVNELYAMRGKRVEHFDLRKGKLDDETLERVLIGPTGNLRAPTFRVGKTLLVGFDEATYRSVLGG